MQYWLGHKHHYTACADLPNIVAQRHIFGGAHPEGASCDLHVRACPRFLYNALTAQVASSYVYSFRSCVEKRTNILCYSLVVV